MLGLLLAAALVLSAPASALRQRGHVYSPSLSFGGPGSTESKFDHPAGIAVNDATGDFYVADRDNGRVEEFEPKLNSEGKPTFVGEFKVPHPLYVAVDNSTSASDPSKGDVYVVGASSSEKDEPEPSDFRVYKFSATGTPITKLTKIKIKIKGGEEFEEEFEGLKGVAVDASGALFVDQEEEVYEFNDEEKNKAVAHVTSAAGEVRPGLAVNSEDDLYTGVGEVEEITGASPFEEEETRLIEEEDLQSGLFESGEFDVASEIDGATGTIEHHELDPEDTTAIAVNPANEPANQVSELDDVYITNLASVAGEDLTTIAEFNPAHELIQRFGASGLQDGDGIAVDSKTGAVYVADGKNDRVDIFELEPPAPPVVGDLSACTLEGGPGCPTGRNAVTLKAQVDPEDLPTHYHFEYGAHPCSPSTPCTSTPEQPAGEGLTGFADQSVESEALSELPTGVYHYRIAAKNKEGETTSPEGTFTVTAAAGGLPDHRSWELVSPAQKEGAEAESISSVGGAIQAAANGNAIAYLSDGPIGTRVQGNRSPEFTQDLAAIGAQEWSTQDLTTGNNEASGLKPGLEAEYRIFSPDLALAALQPYPGQPGKDLAEPPLSKPLSEAEKGHQEKTIYLRANAPEALLASETSQTARENYAAATREEGTGYLALVTPLNAPDGEPFGGGEGATNAEGVYFPGLATPDLSHVVFESFKAGPGIYEWGPREGCSTTEEPLCTGGDIQPVSMLPGATAPLPPQTRTGPPEQASLGGAAGKDLRHAISDDGNLIFWTKDTPSSRDLYVRDTATHETLQLDALQGGSGEGDIDAQFQTASGDGSRVFFTDTQRLTPDAKAREDASDLYVAELSGGGAPGSPLSYTLTDLTPEGAGGESADVLVNEDIGGGVIGASEDGSYVYFVANGRLAPGAEQHGGCPEQLEAPQPTCYLYVRHYESGSWQPTKLIATLSYEDSPDWGGQGPGGDLAFMTSRVSPNGRYLAFMSDRSLTGYDNIDQNEETGRHADEEVYLYDAADGRLACASCNPSGERPVGLEDLGSTETHGGLGATPVIDRLEIWAPTLSEHTDHWLAGDIPGWTTSIEGIQALYQSRYLSNEGRLFFNSPDHLVPAATGEKAKVYEYEPDGLGTCESAGGCVGLISSGDAKSEAAFIDASEDGDDVFFVTADQLVQQDTDDFYDVYDARVCEPSSRCLEAPAGGSPRCQSEQECRSESPASSPFEAPASEAVSGSGSVSAQHEVLSEKVSSKPKPKPLTRAQKLAKALKACKRDKKRSKRLACERAAHRTYGPHKAKKSSAKRRPR